MVFVADVVGSAERATSPIGSAMRSLKRQRAFKKDPVSSGLPQAVLDSLCCEGSTILTSKGCNDAWLTNDDLALRHLRRTRAFAGDSKAAALIDKMRLQPAAVQGHLERRSKVPVGKPYLPLREVGNTITGAQPYCLQLDVSPSAHDTGGSEAELLRVRRTRAFLGEEEAASLANAAWLPTLDDAVCGTPPKAPRNEEATSSSPSSTPPKSRRRPSRLSIVIEDEPAPCTKVTTPSHGGA